MSRCSYVYMSIYVVMWLPVNVNADLFSYEAVRIAFIPYE